MANIDNVQLPDGSSYNIVDNTSGFASQSYVDSAVSSITKTTIGLGNVDNTSDLSKPISTATQAALDTLDEDKADKTDIATVESGTTASRAYSVGELVYVSGTLYKVKTAIASGATFTPGTNVEVTNVSNAIGNKGSVSVTANGVKTFGALLNELYALINPSKMSNNAVIKYNKNIYRLDHLESGNYIFQTSRIHTSYESFEEFRINSASAYWSANCGANSFTAKEKTNDIATSGEVIELFY